MFMYLVLLLLLVCLSTERWLIVKDQTAAAMEAVPVVAAQAVVVGVLNPREKQRHLQRATQLQPRLKRRSRKKQVVPAPEFVGSELALSHFRQQPDLAILPQPGAGLKPKAN